MIAAYLTLTPDELLDRAHKLEALLDGCTLCPRACGAQRRLGETGRCREGSHVRIANAAPHFGEEDVLVGVYGSGTIFFSGCNLDCVFCQNARISRGSDGHEIDNEELARIMLDLQSRGCHNINLVSPTHALPFIVDAVAKASTQGLELPLVYNTGGYDELRTLRLLDGIVDIYMPDFKYGSNEAGSKYSGVPDYFDVATKALREMHRQVGDLRVGPRGIATRGLLVRHLLLPNNAAASDTVFSFLADEISRDCFVNVMEQYYPVYQADSYPTLSRRITRSEFQAAIRQARAAGLHRYLPE